MSIALAIHGGAWNVPDEDLQLHLDGISAALQLGWGLLQGGAGALATVEQTVRALEDNPVFNAGKGSHLNRLGRVELDASIMEGDHLDAGAVAAVERVRNPITLARQIMEHSPHVLLVGEGARRFAEENGVQLCRARDLLIGRARERYLRIRAGETELVEQEFATETEEHDGHMGTVGAVAIDHAGLIVAGTSTGGTLDKYPGRVGDSPLIGAGTYADSQLAAASCTGWGEGILRVVMAKSAIDRIAAGMNVEQAGQAALGDLERVRGRGGMVLIDRHGNATAAFNTPRMARGIATLRDGARVGVESQMRPQRVAR